MNKTELKLLALNTAIYPYLPVLIVLVKTEALIKQVKKNTHFTFPTTYNLPSICLPQCTEVALMG